MDPDIGKPPVVISTLDSKTYYYFTSLLKKLGIYFVSISPGDDLTYGVKLVLTTYGEKNKIRSNKILCREDLVPDEIIASERIFSLIYGENENVLVVGIDPGEKTGVVVYYRGMILFEEITRSFEETMSKIMDLIQKSQALKKIVRIGDGNIKISKRIAEGLSNKFKDIIIVELVDEKGTSNIVHQYSIKGPKDLRSAKLISFRKGRQYRI
jgi:hypothetical protein